MSKTMETVEPGVYRRIDPRTGRVLPRLWIHYGGPRGKTIREPVGSTSIVAARRLRAKRIEEHGRGEPGRAGETIRVETLLDGLVTHYKVNGFASTDTLTSRVAVLRGLFGHLRAIDLTTDVVERQQRAWQDAGLTNGTINHYGNHLRAAFKLGVKARRVHLVPYIPRLKPHSPRGQYITRADAARLAEHLPAYLADFFTVARAYGIRKGQLAKTLRRYVDLERGVIAWPPEVVKSDEAHTVPLQGEVETIVARLMTSPPLHCPFLFHGPDCKPGHRPSQRYGCTGDFKRAWRTACQRAGLPVGRKAGGYVFHHTRNTAATELRAGGMDEADAMKITGHKTSHIFKRYALDDVDALRERLASAQDKVAASLSQRRQRTDRAAKAS